MNTHTVKITFTDQELEDILESAFGGSGIWYWAEEMIDVGGDKTKPYNSQVLTNGGHLRIKDSETSKWHYLTLKKLLKGLEIAIKAGEFEPENFDGPQADSVVQRALFGEVVYG